MKSCDPATAHYCPNPSKYQVRLYRKLKEIGIDSDLQYWNGREHINIAILQAKLYIVVEVDRESSRIKIPVDEVPGENGTSGVGFKTLFFSNEAIRENVQQIAQQIAVEVKDRQNRLS